MDADYRLSWTFLIEHLQFEKKMHIEGNLKHIFFCLKNIIPLEFSNLQGF